MSWVASFSKINAYVHRNQNHFISTFRRCHGFSCSALSPTVLLSAESELHKHPPITNEAPSGLGNGSPRVDDANPAPTSGSNDWITVASKELVSAVWGDGEGLAW